MGFRVPPQALLGIYTSTRTRPIHPGQHKQTTIPSLHEEVLQK